MPRIAATLLLALLASACAGTRARQSVLIPAMQQSWPQIRALADLAAAPDQELLIDAFDAAMASGDADQIVLVPWLPIRTLAMQGVQLRVEQGTLGQFGAGSYRTNILLFDEAYNKLKEKYNG